MQTERGAMSTRNRAAAWHRAAVPSSARSTEPHFSHPLPGPMPRSLARLCRKASGGLNRLEVATLTSWMLLLFLMLHSTWSRGGNHRSANLGLFRAFLRKALHLLALRAPSVSILFSAIRVATGVSKSKHTGCGVSSFRIFVFTLE